MLVAAAAAAGSLHNRPRRAREEETQKLDSGRRPTTANRELPSSGAEGRRASLLPLYSPVSHSNQDFGENLEAELVRPLELLRRSEGKKPGGPVISSRVGRGGRGPKVGRRASPRRRGGGERERAREEERAKWGSPSRGFSHLGGWGGAAQSLLLKVKPFKVSQAHVARLVAAHPAEVKVLLLRPG